MIDEQRGVLANIEKFPTTAIPKLLNNFTIHEQIGRGNFHISVVHRANYNNTDVAVRLGTLFKDSYSNVNELNYLFNEKAHIRHENVVRMFAYAINELDLNGHKYVSHASVLELMQISLEEIWQVAAKKVFDQEKLECFLYMFSLSLVAQALTYLDGEHSELAPSLNSILINPRGQVKMSLSSAKLSSSPSYTGRAAKRAKMSPKTVKAFELLYETTPPTYEIEDIRSIRVLEANAPQMVRCSHGRILECAMCALGDEWDDGHYIVCEWLPDEEANELNTQLILDVLEKAKPYLADIRKSN